MKLVIISGMTSPIVINNKDSQTYRPLLTTIVNKSQALSELEAATDSRAVRHILYKYYRGNW